MILQTIICIVAILCLLLYWIKKREDKFWSKLGVSGVQSFLSIEYVKNLFKGIFKFISIADQMKNAYDISVNHKCFGFYSLTNRIVLLRDPELIKQITIKDFDYFQDHVDSLFKMDPESVFSKSLFAMEGKQWRRMRATLSPAFTGSKMRGIFFTIVECGEQFVQHYKEEYLRQSSSGPLELDMKNVFTRFTNDVIATTAFGVKVDSFKNPENTFYKMGQLATQLSIFKIVLLNIFPFLTRFMRINFIPLKVESFFNCLVKETIETREKENIVRADMIQLLMAARKETLTREKHIDDKVTGFATVEEYLDQREQLKLTDGDIAAQAFLFFLGGFETVSSAICFAVLELAINLDIQKKLQDEIDEVMEKCNGKLNYDHLHLMKYLDMVVSEALRKWPPFAFIDRQCVRSYVLNMDDGNRMSLEKGQGFTIPIFGLHMDPKYYPDPTKFDPERFSDERKGEINPSTYLPFGVGPRNCIGSRFALMEIKIALIYLLANFNVELIKKSPIPIVLGTKGISLSIDAGFWVGITPRKK